MTATLSQPASATSRTSGHPKGLYVLAMTEMWERFSFYGMRALLVYYMTKQLAFSQEKSSQIYGLYTGLVYLTPFFGGILADRKWGQRKTVIIGGVLMAIGQFLMASEALFYPAMGFIILGNGAFKPNISTQVGSLYPDGDPRRDRAFGIFYVGINVGATLSPLLCGTLGELYGWHYGFILAGVGMIVALIVYIAGSKHLAPDNVMNVAAGAAPKKTVTTKREKQVIWALVILCALNIVFWGVYEQQGNTLALWADSDTDRHILRPFSDWEMPATWYQSFNPAMIFLFTPFLNMYWARQARNGREPLSVAKMAIGCVLLALSFALLIVAARANRSSLASIWWLVGSTALVTMGELYLSPVGLSLVTKVAPVRMVSMLMGFWFLSSFFGNYMCGFLGIFWEKMSKENFFLMLTVLSAISAVAMWAVIRPLNKALGENQPRPDEDPAPAGALLS